MQKTRQEILEILNHRGSATVHEIVNDLQGNRGKDITAVTVRHHLNLLQKGSLIVCQEIRHHSKPGRPQHVYTLTEQAHQHFPSNYQQLTTSIITQLKKQLPPSGINVILEGVADDMAAGVDIPPDISLDERLNIVVTYLNLQGYDAYWQDTEKEFILHTSNCPYHEIAKDNESLCNMDMRLIASLIGLVPRRLTQISAGDATCSYSIPKNKNMS